MQRFDTVKLERATVTDEGFLRDTPIMTRTGIFTYRNADGSTRREYRPPEEVFKADSLASYVGKPVTLKHPDKMVTSETAKLVTVGTILSEGKQDGEFVRGDIVIHDRSAIDSGKKELSLGYKLDLEYTPGEINGEKYDAIQRNIRVNHLAVVDTARAGPMARLNLDGDQIHYDEEDKTQMKIRLDNGIEYDAAPEVVAAYQKLQADSADIQSKLTTTQAKADTLQVENTKLDTQLKAKDKEHADSLQQAVAQRVSLLSVAEKHKIEKADEMTDLQIKQAVIASVHGDAIELTGKSIEYIDAVFDLAKMDTAARNDAAAKNRQTVNGRENNDGNDKNKVVRADDAQKKMMADMKDAYKTKEGK